MYAFVHIQKSGGTTIKSILRRSFGVRHFDDGPYRDREQMTAADLRRVRRIVPGLKSIAGHRVRPCSDLHEAVPGIRYYTFLRRPSALIFSMFRSLLADDLCGRPDSDRELRAALLDLVQRKSNWQCRRLAGTPSAAAARRMLEQRVTFVGLTERFDESLILLREWMGGARLRIAYRPLNVSHQKLERNRWATATSERFARIRQFLELARHDAELLEAVHAVNREDQQLYDYVLNTVYPAQQARFPGDLPRALADFQTEQTASPLRHADSWSGKFYRNFVVKPLAPWLLGATGTPLPENPAADSQASRPRRAA